MNIDPIIKCSLRCLFPKIPSNSNPIRSPEEFNRSSLLASLGETYLNSSKGPPSSKTLKIGKYTLLEEICLQRNRKIECTKFYA